MITLAPSKDNEYIRLKFAESGIEFSEDSGCVTALQGEELIGFCLYNLSEEKIEILKIHPEKDIMLADGILRSTLHVAAERSIMNAFCSENCAELCRKLDFIKKEEDLSLQIDKLFKSCSSCGK